MSLFKSLPLSKTDIESSLRSETLNLLDELIIYQSIDSTNDHLWQRYSQGKTSPAVCISETQTAGRGRRGDHWHSPASGNLYLSLSWTFPAESSVNGLSIAIGISVINTLKDIGINNLNIKWPNDILYERQKLAGILVESRFGKRYTAVVGIGLNFKLPIATQNKIQQATTSLEKICTQLPCRNELAGNIIQNMITTLKQFQTSGLHSFIPQWRHYDALKNHAIRLIGEDEEIHAIAQGIDQEGQLIYRHNDALHTLSNSHVSIRFA